MMKLLLASYLILGFGVTSAFAQGNDTLSCTVAIFDAGAKHWGMHSLPSITKLGEFDAVTTNRLTSRSFKILQTGLFVSASVSPKEIFDPEDEAQISFLLVISRRPQIDGKQPNIKQGLYTAAAYISPKNLDLVSVSTVMQRRKRPWIVNLECRKDKVGG